MKKHTYLIIDADAMAQPLNGERWRCKIGRACNPWSRARGMQTGNASRLELGCTIPGDQWELLLHDLFRMARISGEWFALSPEDVLLVASIAWRHEHGSVTEYLWRTFSDADLGECGAVDPLSAHKYGAGWDHGLDFGRVQVPA